MPFRLKAPLTALLIAASLAGCWNGDRDSLLASARKYRQNGELRAAIIEFKNVLEQHPDDGETRYMLATTYNETGEALTAEKEIRRAINLGYPPQAAMPELARALLLQGEYKKALKETAATTRNDAQLLCLRGDAHRALGETGQARELYQQVLQAHPKYPAALLGMGRLAQNAGDQTLARNYAAQAQAAAPRNTDALLFHGDLYRHQPAVALAAFDRILAISPEHRSAHIEKAYIYISQAKFMEAQAELNTASETGPQGMLLMYTQALLFFSQGKNGDALEWLQKVLRAAPNHMPSVLMAGAITLNMGSYQQAEYYLGNYVKANPDNLYARKLLASTLLKNGQAPAALAVLQPAMTAAQQDPEVLALAGQTYMQSRDFGKASELFQKASELDPKAANLRTSLGLSKLGKGQDVQALAELQNAAKLDKNSAHAGIALVTTELSLKRYNEALAAVQALEQTQAKNPVVHNLKGMVQAAREDKAAARAAFNQALVLDPAFFPAAANLAQLEISLKDQGAARKHLEGFLARNPKHIEAMTALAALAAAQRNLPEATRWLEQAHTDHPEATVPAIRLVNHYLMTREHKKALTLASALQVAQPDNPDLLDLLGKAQLAGGDYQGALDSYKKLSAVMPRSPQAHMQVAALYLALKNTGAAEDHLKTALGMQPDFPAAQLAQAEIYVQRGSYELALMIARQLQKVHPKATVGYQLQGDILMMQKKLALALPAYEQAWQTAKSSELLVKTVTVLRATGKTAEGTARLSQWLAQHPDDVRVLLYKGDLLLANRQYKAAADYFQPMAERYPDNVTVWNNLAWAAHQVDDPRALKAAEQAYKLAPQMPVVMDTLGWLLVDKGDAARGVTILKKACATDPAARDIRYHLAMGLFKTGDKASARKEVDTLLAGNMQFAQADEVRALSRQLQ